MKNLIKNIKENYLSMIVVLLIGLLFGWVLFHNSGEQVAEKQNATEEVHDHSSSAKEIWTCSMHPQIRSDKPGKCPICGMDLIPLKSADETMDMENNKNALTLTDAAAKLADVETVKVEKGHAEKEIFLQGKVYADETKDAEISARFGGRIEKLYVNFTGQDVVKGQKLASVYSPELISAQKELFEAVAFKNNRPNLYKAARAKLKLWDLTENQIDNIEKQGEPQLYVDILSPISGTVLQRSIAQGDYVEKGTNLFHVVDLSKVWVMFDAYESDLPWIGLNDKVSFRLKAIPDKKYEAKVNYVDPFLDDKSRVAKVRVEVNNSDKKLKPEMFVNGYITSSIAEKTEDILIPKTSILWTGKRAIVYVKKPGSDNTFEYRQVTLGPEAANFYVIANGLKEGEEVVVNGVFKVDATSQLQGLKSMMNPGVNEKDNTKSSSVSDKFKEQLTAVYKAYLMLKDALVKSDKDLSKEMALDLKSSLGKTDMELLHGETHIKWMKDYNKMETLINSIISSKNLEDQRFEFSKLSPVFYNTVKDFGLKNQTAYYQFCPMANDNEGAYWLSDEKEIKNPYFGDMMLNCGEVKEIIK